jgi:hypothetical protein
MVGREAELLRSLPRVRQLYLNQLLEQWLREADPRSTVREIVAERFLRERQLSPRCRPRFDTAYRGCASWLGYRRRCAATAATSQPEVRQGAR